MVAVEGQFTFTAERPQLSCAAFFMAEPNEVISVEYDGVDVDCSAGDFITVSEANTTHNDNDDKRDVRCDLLFFFLHLNVGQFRSRNATV